MQVFNEAGQLLGWLWGKAPAGPVFKVMQMPSLSLGQAMAKKVRKEEHDGSVTMAWEDGDVVVPVSEVVTFKVVRMLFVGGNKEWYVPTVLVCDDVPDWFWEHKSAVKFVKWKDASYG